MSQENAEIVGDYLKGRYRTADIWDPNGDYYPVAKFPESRPCHGHKEIARFFRDFEQAWGTVEITVENSTPIGDDRVSARCIIERVERAGSAWRRLKASNARVSTGLATTKGGDLGGPAVDDRAARARRRFARSRRAAGVGDVPRHLPMPPQDLGMLMQEQPIQLVERVAGLMRIPALRHRRHRLPAALPGKPLQRPDRGRLRDRLAPRPWTRPRQPPQLLQRGRIKDRAGAHLGRLRSEISSFPTSRPTWGVLGGRGVRVHPHPRSGRA
jgi:hypothetical protein